jgi:hypothetical protein
VVFLSNRLKKRKSEHESKRNSAVTEFNADESHFEWHNFNADDEELSVSFLKPYVHGVLLNFSSYNDFTYYGGFLKFMANIFSLRTNVYLLDFAKKRIAKICFCPFCLCRRSKRSDSRWRHDYWILSLAWGFPINIPLNDNDDKSRFGTNRPIRKNGILGSYIRLEILSVNYGNHE